MQDVTVHEDYTSASYLLAAATLFPGQTVLCGVRGDSMQATAAGWHESKCSRIEHARTPPSDADIRAWCGICRAGDQAADLIAASRAADSTWTQWRRLERPGLRRIQESVIPLWESTREFRIYSPFLVPGPVQTAAYIRALLKAVRDRRPNLVDDIEQAVEVRIATQRVTREGDHRFTIVLEENPAAPDRRPREAPPTGARKAATCPSRLEQAVLG